LNPKVTIYVGIRQCGKTTKAQENVSESVRLTGWPVLTIDATGAKNLRHLRHVDSCAEAVRSIWTDRVHAAIIPRPGRLGPKTEAVDEVRFLMSVAAHDKAGYAIILFDEFGFWARGNTIAGEILNVLRTPTHTNLDLHLTTQYLGDLNPKVFQCITDAHVFRVNGEYGLKRVRTEFSLDPAKVSALKQGEHLTAKMGF